MNKEILLTLKQDKTNMQKYLKIPSYFEGKEGDLVKVEIVRTTLLDELSKFERIWVERAENEIKNEKDDDKICNLIIEIRQILMKNSEPINVFIGNNKRIHQIYSGNYKKVSNKIEVVKS